MARSDYTMWWCPIHADYTLHQWVKAEGIRVRLCCPCCVAKVYEAMVKEESSPTATSTADCFVGYHDAGIQCR